MTLILRLVLIAYTASCLAVFTYVPWLNRKDVLGVRLRETLGYAWVWQPPEKATDIDYYRVVLAWAIATSAMALVVLVLPAFRRLRTRA